MAGTNQKRVGEYLAEHLGPDPERLSEYMTVWNRVIKQGLIQELLTSTPQEVENARLEEQRLILEELRPLQLSKGYLVASNLVTTVGKNFINDTIFLGSAFTASMRMGLKGTGAPVVGDTQASHASWLEQGLANAPVYSGNRKTVTMGAAAAGVSLSPVQAFAITSSGTVFGCFINMQGSATKDDTTGTLLSAGDFTGGSRVVNNLDTLSVTYQMTAA